MRLHLVLSIAAAGWIGQASAASNTTTTATPKPLTSTWYPCSAYTFAGHGEYGAQCMTYRAPLCHQGICETPANVYPTINIFVKQLPAVGDKANQAANVWMFASGPSSEVESSMVALHEQMGGAVNVYTMDLRGMGRSTLLECVSSQITMSGSKSGAAIDPTEVAPCARELQNKYGNLASFSIASATLDVYTFITEHTNGARTFAYGRSHIATMMLQRLMQMNPPNVVGYVFDSVTASLVPMDKKTYFSNWDVDFNEVGEQFMKLCSLDSGCNSRFTTTTLSATLHNVLVQFESNPNSTCAALVGQMTEDTPSSGLRAMLGGLLTGPETRSMIAPVVHRLNRCDANDVNALTQFFTINNQPSQPDENEVYFSLLLYQMTIFSEMWVTPSPTYAELEARYKTLSITNLGMHDTVPVFCAFSKEQSQACDEFLFGRYEANAIMTPHDQYSNKVATVPDQASVLLMGGKLSPQAPFKYAEYLFEALNTPRKELVGFEYGLQIVLDSTPYGDGNSNCAMDLLVSFVSSNGDLTRLDKSCVAKMPAFDMVVPPPVALNCFGTEDMYDGVIAPVQDTGSVTPQ